MYLSISLYNMMMEFSGYYFYMKTSIKGDFQICISVPLKNSHYACIPLYMHKTPPTGNEKEQQHIKFYKKSLSELIFSQVTKNIKIIYFTCPIRRVLKKLHHWWVMSISLRVKSSVQAHIIT